MELVYDGRHRARMLFRESLMYRSRYDPSPRESVHLTLAATDDRPFMLSTPRVTTDRGVVVPMPLGSDAIDVLAQARFSPVALGALRDAVGPEVASSPIFDRLWTEDPGIEVRPWTGGLRIRYFGHACLVFETADVTVMADPFVSPRSRIGPLQPHGSAAAHRLLHHYPWPRGSLRDRDASCALRHRIGTVIVPANLGGELLDPSLRLCLEHLGFRDVVEVRDLDQIPIPGGEIVALPFAGEHGDLAIGAKSTYLVRMDGRTSMVGADTRALPPELYQMVAQLCGPVDDVFLGLECEGAPLGWMYGPLFPGPVPRKLSLARRLNGSDAAEAIEIALRVRSSRIFVYALGEEPWLQHVMATNYTPESYQLVQAAVLADSCKERAIDCQHLVGKASFN